MFLGFRKTLGDGWRAGVAIGLPLQAMNVEPLKGERFKRGYTVIYGPKKYIECIDIYIYNYIVGVYGGVFFYGYHSQGYHHISL